MSRRTRAGVAALAALAALATSCSGSLAFPEGSTEQGNDIRDLWVVFTIAGIAVAAIVYALIAWSLVRYRRRPGDGPDALGRQFREHVPIEIVYTSIPVLIVIALFTVSVRTDDRVTELAADPLTRVEVTAFAWGWRFVYPEEGVTIVSPPSAPGEPGPELVLPVGGPSRIVLRSNDVVHAFWVPDFNFKRDAVPGRASAFDLTPTATGTHRGVCSEFCGLNHAFMTFVVRVVEPAEFDSWAAAEASGAEAA